MVQRVYRQLRAVDPQADITIATSRSQVSSIRNQLGQEADVCVEPYRRDTFPAIALSAAYLKDCKKKSGQETAVVCPVDPFVEDAYFYTLKELEALAADGETDLALMGIAPTYPSEKYGYLIPQDSGRVSRVLTFREKPDRIRAQEYMDQGGLWNGGVFAFRLDYVLEQTEKLTGWRAYCDLLEHYASLPKISFDYAVAEKAGNVKAIRFYGQWKDLGTWNTLTESMTESHVGEAMMNETCRNVHVINELDVPVLCMGLKDIVVSASPEGILVSDKEQSSYIKPFVDEWNRQIMFAEKSWGSFRVIDVEDESMTIRVTLNAGHRMNYHSHDFRDEVWTVISGKGRTIVDGKEKAVGPGDVVLMPAGCRHTIIAESELKVIEVQLGKEISIHDKHKFDWPDPRTGN